MVTAQNQEKWSSASLRISSKSLSVTRISSILKTEPSRSIEKGSPISLRIPSPPLSEESRWLLNSGVDDSEPLEEHIRKLLSYIEQNITAFKTLLVDCEVDMRCAFSSDSGQGGFVLDAELLKRLSAIPIDMVVSLYPPGESESQC